MTVIDRLLGTFGAPHFPDDTPRRHTESENKVISARSHGNVLLQLGKFYTKEDVDVAYERNKKRRFSTH